MNIKWTTPKSYPQIVKCVKCIPERTCQEHKNEHSEYLDAQSRKLARV